MFLFHSKRHHAIHDESGGDLLVHQFIGGESGTLVVWPGFCTEGVAQLSFLVQRTDDTCIKERGVSVTSVSTSAPAKPLCRAIGAHHLVIGAEGIRGRKKNKGVSFLKVVEKIERCNW